MLLRWCDRGCVSQGLQAYLERTLGEVVNTGAMIPVGGAGGDRDSMSDSGDQLTPQSPEHHQQQQAPAPVAQQFEAMKISSLLRLPAVVTFSSCFALNERVVAAESCWFVAMVSAIAWTVHVPS